MVYGITIKLAGMKALAVTKQLWANCVGSPRETDAAVRYPQNTDFSRTVGTTATKLTGMTVPPVSNPRQTNNDCTVRQTRSLLLPTQAYNSSHFYMVRLVWFPGYMDWERRYYTWEIRGQTRTFAERGHLHNVYPWLRVQHFWAKWGVVRAPNAITRSAQSHLTTATKDGAQIERHLMRVHSQKE